MRQAVTSVNSSIDGHLRPFLLRKSRRMAFYNYSAAPAQSILAPDFFATAATPVDILAKLHAAALKVLASPDLQARFALQGAEVVANKPDEALAMLKADIVKWADVAKKSGAKID